MRTRKIISVLRTIVERIVLIMAVLAIAVCLLQQYALCNFAYKCWPIGVAFMVCYTVLTFCEDYLNDRFIHHGFR